MAITIFYIIDDPLSTLNTEINIDIRHTNPFRI